MIFQKKNGEKVVESFQQKKFYATNSSPLLLQYNTIKLDLMDLLIYKIYCKLSGNIDLTLFILQRFSFLLKARREILM